MSPVYHPNGLFPPPSDHLRRSTAPPLAEGRARILAVEPDMHRHAVLGQLLRSDGYDSLLLNDGDELMRLAAEYEPDLILLSYEMPVGSGLELCGELRACEPQRHVPVILIGETDDEHCVARGLLAGADDFFCNPGRTIELSARIRVQLRNKRFYDALHRVRNERDSLRRDAQIDPLTGLLNRRSLEALVRERCQRNERFGLLFMDLDNFKIVNDTFGHEMGDRALRSVTQVLDVGIRPGDAVARYGGEEFVAIIAGAGPESARLVAERLRRAVEELKPLAGGPEHLTMSVGATVFDPRRFAEDAESLLRRADRALYSAKSAGRNRVVMFHPDEDLVSGRISVIHSSGPKRAPIEVEGAGSG